MRHNSHKITFTCIQIVQKSLKCILLEYILKWHTKHLPEERTHQTEYQQGKDHFVLCYENNIMNIGLKRENTQFNYKNMIFFS